MGTVEETFRILAALSPVSPRGCVGLPGEGMPFQYLRLILPSSFLLGRPALGRRHAFEAQRSFTEGSACVHLCI
uniref:Uncharacterized protein n=1 Tax=Anguilla anguilla TaxID=7936 RepID=A0A0E9WNT5_ANGAN